MWMIDRTSGVVRSSVVPLLLGAILTGCATFPEQKKIAAFGNTTKTIAEAGKSVFRVSAEIRAARAEEAGVLSYLKHELVFPPRYADFPGVAAEQRRVRLRVLQAIAGYAGELAKIGEPGSASNAAGKAKNLGDTVLAAISISGSPPQPAQALPTLASGSVRFLAGGFLAARMRSVMRRTHPDLKTAVALLRKDFDVIAKVPRIHFQGLIKTRRSILARLRRDPQNSTLELRAVYLEMARLQREAAYALASIDNLPRALAKLVSAHEAMMTSVDTDRALSDFTAASEDVIAGLKAIISAKGEEK